MSTDRFTLGEGSGSRLLAPGLPDDVFATESLKVWVASGCLWLESGGEVTVRDAETLVGFVAWQDRVVTVWQAHGRYTINHELSDRPPLTMGSARGVDSGVDWAVLDLGHERQVICLASGDRKKIPVGASDARPQPWEAGPGILWLDGEQVYRFEEGDKPRSCGRLPCSADRWRAGPQGSGLFDTDDGIYVLAPGRGLSPIPGIDFGSARFGPDGLMLAGATETGVAWWDLKTGEIRAHLEGRLIPVGFDRHPLLLDEDLGVIRTWSGDPVLAGLTPSAVALHGDRLYGPGGTAWNIATATRAWATSPIAGDHLMATDGGVIQVDDRIIGYDTDGNKVFDLPLPIDDELDGDIYSAHWVNGMMYFEVEEGWVQVDFTGRRLGDTPCPSIDESERSLPEGWTFDTDSGEVTGNGERCPIRFDGVVATQDQRVLAWSEDGVLCILDVPSPTRQSPI